MQRRFHHIFPSSATSTSFTLCTRRHKASSTTSGSDPANKDFVVRHPVDTAFFDEGGQSSDPEQRRKELMERASGIHFDRKGGKVDTAAIPPEFRERVEEVARRQAEEARAAAKPDPSSFGGERSDPMAVRRILEREKANPLSASSSKKASPQEVAEEFETLMTGSAPIPRPKEEDDGSDHDPSDPRASAAAAAKKRAESEKKSADNAGDASPSGSTSRYKYFEDHFTKKESNPLAERKFEYYEDQIASAQVLDETEEKEETYVERLRRLHNPDKFYRDEKTGAIHQPEDYAWRDDLWGPAPGKRGHKAWYKKDSKYMNPEEKAKLETTWGLPIQSGKFWRNMPKSYEHAMMPTVGDMIDSEDENGQNMWDKHAQHVSDPGKTTNPTFDVAYGTYGKKRKNFLEEWLKEDGVKPENMSVKLMEHDGIQHNGRIQSKVVKAHAADWELSPRNDGIYE